MVDAIYRRSIPSVTPTDRPTKRRKNGYVRTGVRKARRLVYSNIYAEIFHTLLRTSNATILSRLARDYLPQGQRMMHDVTIDRFMLRFC